MDFMHFHRFSCISKDFMRFHGFPRITGARGSRPVAAFANGMMPLKNLYSIYSITLDALERSADFHRFLQILIDFHRFSLLYRIWYDFHRFLWFFEDAGLLQWRTETNYLTRSTLWRGRRICRFRAYKRVGAHKSFAVF